MRVIRFNSDVPLEKTLAFEALYPESERLNLAGKKEFREKPGAIFAWMFVNGNLAGETYGIPITGPLPGLAGPTDSEKEPGIHCYSNTILPGFQDQGLGKILKSYWLGLAAGRGFEFVYGYARPGASQALNAGFGAVFLESFPDWCGTGEVYRLYCLHLRSTPLKHR